MSIGVHFIMNGSKYEEDCNEFDDVQLVTDALRYAQGKGYRSDCFKNSKCSIRRKAKRFVVNNGDVHYKKNNGTMLRIYVCVCTPPLLCSTIDNRIKGLETVYKFT